jgi:hypothetical protein
MIVIAPFLRLVSGRKSVLARPVIIGLAAQRVKAIWQWTH